MIYVVLFDTEHRSERRTKHYVYHCEAKNAKEAKEFCKEKWSSIFAENPKIPHQFHMHAVRSSSQDPYYLRIVTWRGAVVNGPACFDTFCTGWTNWPRH